MGTDVIRVVLGDDHELVREGLRLLLAAAGDIEVVGEAPNGARGVELARTLAPDVLLLDLDMPGCDGTTALALLDGTLARTRVLILTMYAEQDRLLPLLEAGASGYLTKEAAFRELVEAIRVVAAGEVYVRPAVVRLLASALVPARTARTAQGRYEALSTRERTVLRQVARGYSGTEIARALGISTKTVAVYKRRIQEKLGLEHRTDYVRFAIEAGVLTH